MKPHRPPHTASFSLQAFRLSGFFLALVCLHAFSPSATAQPKLIIDAGFENGMPPGVTAQGATIAIDTTRAHSGQASLLVTPAGAPGAARFKLNGLVNFPTDCEFSVRAYVPAAGKARLYVSMDDGRQTHTISVSTGTLEPGKWNLLRGTMRAADWGPPDNDYHLNLQTSVPCWFDELALGATRLPEAPSTIWPALRDALHATAAKRASTLAPGATIVLDARHAALAPDTARLEVILPAENPVTVPAEGLLVFAIDATEDLNLTGALHLEHTAPTPAPASGIQAFRSSELSLRPGLRVTVLCDDTVIAAPGVRAAPWKGPATDIRGEHPPTAIPLAPFRMTKGRHYITIAGPRIRPGGSFSRLELRAAAIPAEKPLSSFALFADTHIGYGRSGRGGNLKLRGRAADALEAALRQIKNENGSFAIIAGDMTDNGFRDEFNALAAAVKRAGLPVYGCLGNHDARQKNSRASIAAAIPEIFPSGIKNTDYAFSRPPLRFIVLDGAYYWHGEGTRILPHRPRSPHWKYTYRDGMLNWLRDTLAADTATPTIVVSHFQFYLRLGVSDVTGFNLGNQPSQNEKLMAVLEAAPNVVATFNGHHHYNLVSSRNGITCIQNPVFAVWPNAWRVFRVYADRIEWEVRQMSNRGLIREGVDPQNAQLWSLSTFDGDLAGTIRLPRERKN